MKVGSDIAQIAGSPQPQVLLTRPLGQADNLLRILRRAGFECSNLPLFAVRDLPDTAALQADLVQAEQADALVFASPNAVQACFRLRAEFSPQGEMFAQGPATARVMRQHGLNCSVPVDGFTSEDLLSQRFFEQVHGLRIVRISGEGGRELLLASLRDRGAQARALAVYRREPLSWSARHLRLLTRSADSVWVVSSRDSLLELRNRLERLDMQHALHWHLLVSSHRLADFAEGFGFTRLHTAASAASADLRAGLQVLTDRSRGH